MNIAALHLIQKVRVAELSEQSCSPAMQEDEIASGKGWSRQEKSLVILKVVSVPTELFFMM